MKKETWNINFADVAPEGVYFRPTMDSGHLYGIEVRFNNRLYRAKAVDFDSLAVKIFRMSKRNITVMTGKREFKSGMIYLMVDFWGCNSKTVTNVLKFLADDVFARIKKTTSADLDPRN
ncbi:hypothetical protein IJ103_03455 [Candidatus Saccharibacteria bacterium]|nr:hypothetical protein [Candidatus Saccharibacteria bacterium]